MRDNSPVSGISGSCFVSLICAITGPVTVTIDDCFISNNTFADMLIVGNVNFSLANSTIKGNTQLWPRPGGGSNVGCILSANPWGSQISGTVRDCIFSNNKNGLFILKGLGSGLTLVENSIIKDNRGMAIDLEPTNTGQALTISHCTIDNNNCLGNGAIRLLEGASPPVSDLVNINFSSIGNNEGPAISLFDGTRSQVNHCVIYRNQAGCRISNATSSPNSSIEINYSTIVLSNLFGVGAEGANTSYSCIEITNSIIASDQNYALSRSEDGPTAISYSNFHQGNFARGTETSTNLFSEWDGGNNWIGNPNFVDPDNDDYHTQNVHVSDMGAYAGVTPEPIIGASPSLSSTGYIGAKLPGLKAGEDYIE